jgi:hypothetical protein
MSKRPAEGLQQIICGLTVMKMNKVKLLLKLQKPASVTKLCGEFSVGTSTIYSLEPGIVKIQISSLD